MNQANKKILGFNDLKLMIWAAPLVGFVITFGFFGVTEGWEESLIKFLIASFYTFIIWYFSRTSIIYFRKKFPNKSQRKERLIKQSLCGIVLTILICFVLVFIETMFTGDTFGESFKLESLVVSLNFHIMFSAIYEGIYYLKQLHETEQKAKELERANTRSQLETLKNQINPHFLFNSLNTLAAIIPEDADLSVEFVDKLSFVYRYILEIREKETISLAEELNYIQAYLFLLKIRFGENFKAFVNLAEDSKKKHIVPLSLQILIENAIKHNVVSKKKPLTVEIFDSESGKLTVRNNLQKKNAIVQSTQVGLDNINTRYQLLSNTNIVIEETDNTFVVHLPLIDQRNIKQ